MVVDYPFPPRPVLVLLPVLGKPPLLPPALLLVGGGGMGVVVVLEGFAFEGLGLLNVRAALS